MRASLRRNPSVATGSRRSVNVNAVVVACVRSKDTRDPGRQTMATNHKQLYAMTAGTRARQASPGGPGRIRFARRVPENIVNRTFAGSARV